MRKKYVESDYVDTDEKWAEFKKIEQKIHHTEMKFFFVTFFSMFFAFFCLMFSNFIIASILCGIGIASSIIKNCTIDTIDYNIPREPKVGVGDYF